MPHRFPHARFLTRALTLILLSAGLAGCLSSPAAPTATIIPPTFTLPAPTALPTRTSTPTPAPSATPVPTATPLPIQGESSLGDPYAPTLGNTGYDVLHYDLALTLDPRVAFLRGSALLTVAARLHNLVGFSLDFSGFDIGRLTIDGEEAAYTRDLGKLFITPPEPLSLDQVFEVRIDYSGSPAQTGSLYVPFLDHLGIQFLGTNAYALNQPDGAHYWFPCNDHPLDKAAFSFAIEVPEGLLAVANGTQAGTENGETGTTYFWEHPYPMAPYLAMVAVGEYTTVADVSPGGIPIRHFVFDDIQPEFLAAASVTGEALDWMSETFSPYPFDSFGFVTTRIIRASLETQGNVLLSEHMLNEETIVHEITHMWFGDWVSMASWADMWHNEGFAVYLSILWATRDRPEALPIFMQNLEARVGREASTDPLGNLRNNLLFGFDSYQRGALMIHKLRQTVGDEAFFGALRNYLNAYGGGTATRDDFQQAFEETSGMDLSGFFTDWLDTPDFP